MRNQKPVVAVSHPTGIGPDRRSPMPPGVQDTLDDNSYRDLDLAVLCDLFELYEEGD